MSLARSRAAHAAPLLFVATALGATALARPAHACEFPENRVTSAGILGADSRALSLIPRNAAFLWTSSDGAEPPAGPFAVALESMTLAPIMGRIVRPIAHQNTGFGTKPPGIFLAKTDELLPPDHAITALANGVQRAVFTTADYVDDMPPPSPRVTNGSLTYHDGEAGCGGKDSCGVYTYLQFGIAEPVKDDRAPPELVTYAVYLEKSAEQARAATTPFVLLAGPHALSTFVDEAWLESDAFISVSALDFAANESPRSEPFQINAAESGCAVASQRRRPLASATALLGLAALGWVRRRIRVSAKTASPRRPARRP